MVHEFKYQKKHSLEKRKAESSSILSSYPDRIPVIVEKNTNSKLVDTIDKNKFLVPNDITVGQFQYIIRKRIKLNQNEALFIFTENSELIATSNLMNETYKRYKSEDGFLYFSYNEESTFGNL